MRAAVLRLMIGGIALLLLSTTAYAQGKTPDACAVVAKAEVEQAFGAKLQNGLPQEPIGSFVSSCVFLTTDKSAEVRVGLRQDEPDSRAEEKEGLAASTKLRPVTGIGTDAFAYDIEGLGVVLVAYRGPRDAFQVSAMGFRADAKATQAGLEKVARLALSRWK